MSDDEPTIDELFEIARDRHRAGDVREAERLYREVIRRRPTHPEAHWLLGAIAKETGNLAAAIELFRRAVALHPVDIDYWMSLAKALDTADRLDEAAEAL